MKRLMFILFVLLFCAAHATVHARVVATAPPAATASRPAGNTGTGFFVVVSGGVGRLYDPSGKEFRIRGVNHLHWDQGAPGLWLSNANTERVALDFTQPTSTNLNIINNQILAHKIVPMPGNWTATCKSDTASLSAAVDTWIAQASTFTTINSNGLVNIANEWGPPAWTQQLVSPWALIPNYTWRDGYITAVKRMRAAGYTGTLVVDAGGCGQDSQTVIRDGAAVLASDPQHNILFDVHVYGGFVLPATASWMQDYATSMAALKATGLPMFIGEFGPGKNIGPSPTPITPQQIITTAEANGWGWLAWAWDDNDLDACQTSDNWFGMTKNCGVYTGQNSELTTFGLLMVPILKAMALPAAGLK